MNTENQGKRNLIILGVGAILITATTTGLSLWIYRTSGDIYLDRSRPGFLPDEDEAKEELPQSTNFTFSDTGELNQEELEKYLQELKKLNERIDAIAEPYSDAPLSNQSLGIDPTPEANSEPSPEE